MAKLKEKKKALPLEVLQRASADENPEFQATCISSHHVSKVKMWLASPDGLQLASPSIYFHRKKLLVLLLHKRLVMDLNTH